MDLGKKIEKGEDGLPVSSVAGAPDVSYPSFSLNDKVAEEFEKQCDCKMGDTLTATVKLKVTGYSDDQIGKRVQLDVLSLDNVSEEGGEKGEGETKDGDDVNGADNAADENPGDKSGEEPTNEGQSNRSDGSDDEEKVLGYKRPKAFSKREAPKISAKDLAY